MTGHSGKRKWISMSGERENFRFYFPVFGFYDGETIHFGIDSEVQMNDLNRYIFDEAKNEWVASDEKLEDWDHKVFLSLLSKISNIKYDKE